MYWDWLAAETLKNCVLEIQLLNVLPGICEKVIVPSLPQTSCDLLASDYHAGSNSAETWQLEEEKRGFQRNTEKKAGVRWGVEALFIVYSANMLHCVKLDSSPRAIHNVD
ncbi:uncharacterized [Tachysurus ichikawai]